MRHSDIQAVANDLLPTRCRPGTEVGREHARVLLPREENGAQHAH